MSFLLSVETVERTVQPPVLMEDQDEEDERARLLYLYLEIHRSGRTTRMKKLMRNIPLLCEKEGRGYPVLVGRGEIKTKTMGWMIYRIASWICRRGL